MTAFSPSGAYDSSLDIRFGGRTVPSWAHAIVAGRRPNAECWLVVMPRRGGKTWLASGIADARPEGSTQRIDLRDSRDIVRRAGLLCLLGERAAPRRGSGLLLIDEPGLGRSGDLAADAAALAAGLARVGNAGLTPVLFATPLEHSALVDRLSPDAPKDVVVPPPLNADEVDRLAGRQPDWAPELVAALRTAAPRWLQTPFLLELALHVAQELPELRTDLPRLVRAAIDEANARHVYLSQLFDNGLSAGQRMQLRAERWRSAGLELTGPTEASHVLRATTVGSDPILGDHLPDVLRIHHISDLHIGGNLRSTIDVKDRSAAGRRIAALAGDGTPLDSYLNHVRQLATASRAPHIVVVTGDIVNRPNSSDGVEALRWLTELEHLLAGHPDLAADDPRVLLVGGNHDVSWDLSLDARPETRHRWFADTFSDYPHPHLQEPDGARRPISVDFRGIGLRVFLLGSAESGGEVAADEDRQQLAIHLKQLREAPDESAVRALVRSFDRIDPGLVARAILDRLGPATGFVTIAAIHHPLSPVPSVEVAPYAGVVNAGQVKLSLSRARTALLLHGHTHLGFMASERLLDSEFGWTLRIAGAPTLASTATDEQNGYNEVFVSREGGDHCIAIRQIRFLGGQWVPSRPFAFFPGDADETAVQDLVCDRTTSASR